MISLRLVTRTNTVRTLYTYMVHYSPLGKHLAKFVFAAVIIPVSAADEAKSVDLCL